jgi:hypothetical protein
MKKALLIFGAVSLAVMLVVLIGIGAIFAHAAYEGPHLDASSKTFVNESVPVIVGSWSTTELRQRASPELLKLLDDHPGELEKLFAKLSTLGPLVTYDGAKGESQFIFNIPHGNTVTAIYVADVKFKNGDATVNVRLIQQFGEWKFYNFNVNSPSFLK